MNRRRTMTWGRRLENGKSIIYLRLAFFCWFSSSFRDFRDIIIIIIIKSHCESPFERNIDGVATWISPKIWNFSFFTFLGEFNFNRNRFPPTTLSSRRTMPIGNMMVVVKCAIFDVIFLEAEFIEAISLAAWTISTNFLFHILLSAKHIMNSFIHELSIMLDLFNSVIRQVGNVDEISCRLVRLRLRSFSICR